MTTQASPTRALTFLREHVAKHGMPQTPQGWFVLVEQALSVPDPDPDPRVALLEEVALRAKWVYDAWISGVLSRQNGMDDLRQALAEVGL